MKSAFNRSVVCVRRHPRHCGDCEPGDHPGQRTAKAAEEIQVRHQGILDPSARRLVPRRRDRSAKGPGAAIGSADRLIGSRTRGVDEEDKAAAGLQDRSLCIERAGRAADGLGRQGHAVRRLLRPRQRLRHHRQRRQERGQDHPQGPEHADRPRLQGWLALRHRRRQADQIRKCRSQSRQARRRQGGV